MIVIEGADNTGKTTLIESLAKEFRLPTIKSFRPPTVKTIIDFHNWAKAAPRTPVMDRHPAISDYIYGHILRGESPSDPQLIQFLRNQVFLVYCQPPIDTIRGTYLDRAQLEGTHENLDRILSEYESLMSSLEPDFTYDYTNPKSLNALYTHIQHYLRRAS